MSSKKRTLDAFFPPTAKKARPGEELSANSRQPIFSEVPSKYSHHFAYPFPIAELSADLTDSIENLASASSKPITSQPDLDLLYFEPLLPRKLATLVFTHLRNSLPFYRVSYTITRGGHATSIVTPRYTTVFGLDQTSRFDESGRPVDAETRTKFRTEEQYTSITPRPIPQCLDVLRKLTERVTGCSYNFVLVNYYAAGSDSISYHSDDERFLGPLPAIASLSLGAKRDFLLKHKPGADGKPFPQTSVVKLPLASGDMVLMRGKTQSHWLHSVPKRSGKYLEDGGRINITFRKALVKGGTANYYQYNVGTGSVYRWDGERRKMQVWEERVEVKIHRGPGPTVRIEGVATTDPQEVKKVLQEDEELLEKVKKEWEQDEEFHAGDDDEPGLVKTEIEDAMKPASKRDTTDANF